MNIKRRKTESDSEESQEEYVGLYSTLDSVLFYFEENQFSLVYTIFSSNWALFKLTSVHLLNRNEFFRIKRLSEAAFCSRKIECGIEIIPAPSGDWMFELANVM